MPALGELWETLRATGQSDLAPQLITNGIRSVSDLALRSDELLRNGIQQWRLEAVLSGASQQVEAPSGSRHDLPLPLSHQRASLPLALAAAAPNERKRSLECLDRDILARSTNPTQEARVRTYTAICGAWNVEAFPLSVASLRCFGASLKR